jgi:ABC-type polysaccharide/polyol phosphate transport system ATPase subunit
MRAIQAEHLGKRYRLGESLFSYTTLREALSFWLKSDKRSRDHRSEIWALKDVSLSIEAGEVVGIVGRNGAGKTTFLKLVARITQPTIGVVRTRGRVGALLEVGTGFHPELTGRENTYLNGAILGMSRWDINRRFDEIVDFAGISRFLDTPVKRYSSGMYLRLAFSVAAHLEPDIVVVDEVLAVGDSEFQNKCLGRMAEFGVEGRTVILVSHNSGAIAELCDRAIWIDEGLVKDDGPAEVILKRYLESTAPRVARARFELQPSRQLQLVSVAVTDELGMPLDDHYRGVPFSVCVRFASLESIPGLDIAIYLLDQHGIRVVDEALSDQQRGPVPSSPGQHEIIMTLPPVLPAGPYVVGIWMGTHHETFLDTEVLRLTLWPLPDDRQESIHRRRVIQAPVQWRANTIAIGEQLHD